MEKLIACSLTSAELEKHKTEVIAELKAKVLERKELDNGFQYSFIGSDEMIDNISSFIKAERACCNFFSFNLEVAEDNTTVLLKVTGSEGVKDFINQELDF